MLAGGARRPGSLVCSVVIRSSRIAVVTAFVAAAMSSWIGATVRLGVVSATIVRTRCRFSLRETRQRECKTEKNRC
jgi:hypothetical protein